MEKNQTESSESSAEGIPCRQAAPIQMQVNTDSPGLTLSLSLVQRRANERV